MPKNENRAYPIDGDQVLSLSRDKGMTIEDLATEVKVNVRNVRGWLLKGKPVYVKNIIKLANVLDADWKRDKNNQVVFSQKGNPDSKAILVAMVIPGTLATAHKELVDRLMKDIRELAALTGNARIEDMNEGNSVIINVLMDRDDVDRLIVALLDGKLVPLDLLYIRVPSLLGDDKIYNQPSTVETIENEADEPETGQTKSREEFTAKPKADVTALGDDLAAKRQKAEKWVNIYTATGVAAVLAGACIPGSATVTLLIIEASMIYHIGKIYDHKWGVGSSIGSIGILGVASMIGKIVALEAATLLGPFAFVAKPLIAAGIIKTMGRLIIEYFESGGNDPANKNAPDDDGSPGAAKPYNEESHAGSASSRRGVGPNKR